MTKKRITTIAKRIEKIKTDLVSIDAMRPGSLTRQFKDPQNQTGPYYQLSFTRDMRSRTDYIPRDQVREVRRLVANYKRFKALTAEWVDLSIEQCRLATRMARDT